MAGEEVLMEVEAVQAVYGDDCVVLDSYPPHLRVHIKPRTADVSFQQFVEAVIGIRAGPQYPEEPPHINLIDSKGLDGQRQKNLITSIQDKACQLSSCLMLVALCEEAVEKLSTMNHPDGNCPLCLYPLVQEDEQNNILPFMKLMSCFHCFHSECIIRWWKWLQKENENSGTSSNATVLATRNTENSKVTEESMGNCPVCRKVFHAKDFEHVLDLVESHSFQLRSKETETIEDEKLIHSDMENIRREKIDAILKLQEENNGLIELQRNLVVQPGMFLAQPISPAVPSSFKETTDKQDREAMMSETSRVSLKMPSTSEQSTSEVRKFRGRNFSKREPTYQQRRAVVNLETNSSGTLNKLSTSDQRNSVFGKQRLQSSSKQNKQWVKKEKATVD